MSKIAIGLGALLLLSAAVMPAAAGDPPKTPSAESLRTLWANDPTLRASDPLDIHALDESHLGRTPEVVRTSYQPGKGYATDTDNVAGERRTASSGTAR